MLLPPKGISVLEEVKTSLFGFAEDLLPGNVTVKELEALNSGRDDFVEVAKACSTVCLRDSVTMEPKKTWVCESRLGSQYIHRCMPCNFV